MNASPSSWAPAPGFIALYRRVLEHPLFLQLPSAWFKAWIAILLRANYRTSTWWDGEKNIELQPGQFVTSHKSMAEFCGLTEKQIRGTLAYCERAGLVTLQRASRYQVVTVCNWETYQTPNKSEGSTELTGEGRINGTGRAESGQDRGQSQGRVRATEEQSNNKKQIHGQQTPLTGLSSIDDPPFESLDEFALDSQPAKTSSLKDQQAAWFAEWWSGYWLKVAKVDAEKAFFKHVRTAERFATVKAAMKQWAPEMLSKPRGKRPHAATWLNGARWDDELDAPVNGSSPEQFDYPEYRP